MVTAIRFPPAESAFHFTAVHKEVRLRQTEILCESSFFFVPELKDVRDTRIAVGERVPDKVTSGQTNLTPLLIPEQENLCCSE